MEATHDIPSEAVRGRRAGWYVLKYLRKKIIRPYDRIREGRNNCTKKASANQITRMLDYTAGKKGSEEHDRSFFRLLKKTW